VTGGIKREMRELFTGELKTTKRREPRKEREDPLESVLRLVKTFIHWEDIGRQENNLKRRRKSIQQKNEAGAHRRGKEKSIKRNPALKQDLEPLRSSPERGETTEETKGGSLLMPCWLRGRGFGEKVVV